MSKTIAVYGSGWQSAQAALTLADLGIEVELITPSNVLDSDRMAESHGFNHWPLLLRTAIHPRVHLKTQTTITDIAVKAGEYTINYSRNPRFVKDELCTACGECVKVCPVTIDSRTAVHQPALEVKSTPSTYIIEKAGISPCRGGCPLEINVHGYVALIRQGKAEQALKLINDRAPLAGVLGRLCTHPCETKCSRQDVDKPVFIQALHRYAADSCQGEIIYQPVTDKKRSGKIAIIGSGPAGLTAAWELSRRGYSPTVFEANQTAGGMLATGIPEFRLPAEVRQKEIAAIQKLGVKIKTGVHFGKDVDLDALNRAGYLAVFLAIGAHSNNHLNIPGENLKGVVDCISWLKDFNTHQSGQIDEKVVVIGGGNSAVDAARSAKRLSKQEVRILCLTEEMTAVREDVEEAGKEGIPIDYNNSGLEILGENGRVTGVRCIKVRNVKFDAEGKISLEQIPGSEFVVPADRVIIAIGQRPDSAGLKIPGLNTAGNSTIIVNPLTLETALPGVFAGGDAVTGSKDIVSAMAAGLRSAESIDRYIRGVSLSEGRSLEPLTVVKVDVTQKTAAKYHRVKMPALATNKRKVGHSETNLGLSADMAEKESLRCLDCAGCCECLECERVCEVKAVNHHDCRSEGQIQCSALISLLNMEEKLLIPGLAKSKITDAVVKENYRTDLSRITAMALKAAVDSRSIPVERWKDTTEHQRTLLAQSQGRVAVFLCRCGDSVSSLLDFIQLEKNAVSLPGVIGVHQIRQSCTVEGASHIKEIMQNEAANSAVLAACRCCNWDQVCYSCSDRRAMTQENLKNCLTADMRMEYVNIREMAAWLYRDDPCGATRNAAAIIAAGVKRAGGRQITGFDKMAVIAHELIISSSLAGWSAAVKLAQQGYGVTLLTELDLQKLKTKSREYQNSAADLLKELHSSGVDMLPWPDELLLNGSPGRYEAQIKINQTVKTVAAGGVILDIAEMPSDELRWLVGSNVLYRVMKRQNSGFQGPAGVDRRMHQYSIRETAGMVFLTQAHSDQFEEQINAGEAAAAQALIYLYQEALKPRRSAVTINRPLCRGCGDCAKVCALIELKPVSEGLCYAEVDPALCLGCGACIGACPTGAIQQTAQTEEGIEASLEAIFNESNGL